MSAQRITSEGVSWVGRGSFTGVEFVVAAGAGVAEAGTMAGVVDDEATLLEEVCRRSTAKVGCVGPESLRRLRGREESSIKGVPKFPGPRGWFVGKRGKGHWPRPAYRGPGRRLCAGRRPVGVVVGVFCRKSLGIVVRKFALGGADDGADPIIEGTFALAFR